MWVCTKCGSKNLTFNMLMLKGNVFVKQNPEDGSLLILDYGDVEDNWLGECLDCGNMEAYGMKDEDTEYEDY